MPTVSVIVPNYNHARFLRKRIESVLGQTYQDFELILLDDCSTDDSRTILSQYADEPRVRLEFNEVNSGSTFKQWNKGVRLAQGKYVWIAESDDYADPRLLERLVPLFEADATLAYAYCRSHRVSADDKVNGFSDWFLGEHIDRHKWTADFSAEGREECSKYFVRCNSIPNASSVLFRRDAYEGIGGADEKLVFCGDWKTWAAMALSGGTVSYVAEPLNYHRFHTASVTERSERNGVWAIEALHIVSWILEKVDVDRAVRANVCEDLSHLWIPAVLNKRLPISLRWAILSGAAMIDHSALARLARATLTALRMTLARRWRSLRTA